MFIVELIERTVWSATELPYGVRIVLLVFVAAWVALLLHELAHGLVASALGVRPMGITLGRGPVIYRGTVAGCAVRLSLFPLHGEVRFRDEDAHTLGYRNVGREDWRFEWTPESWRAPLISAAGGLANLLAVVALLLYRSWMPPLASPTFALFTMCLVVNLMMFLNLAPIRGLDGGRLVVQTAALRRRAAEGRARAELLP